MPYRIEQRLMFLERLRHVDSSPIQVRSKTARCSELIAMPVVVTPGYAPTAAPPRGSEYRFVKRFAVLIVSNHLVQRRLICARSLEVARSAAQRAIAGLPGFALRSLH